MNFIVAPGHVLGKREHFALNVLGKLGTNKDLSKFNKGQIVIGHGILKYCSIAFMAVASMSRIL